MSVSGKEENTSLANQYNLCLLMSESKTKRKYSYLPNEFKYIYSLHTYIHKMKFKDILTTNTKLYLSENYEKLKADSVLQKFLIQLTGQTRVILKAV